MYCTLNLYNKVWASLLVFYKENLVILHLLYGRGYEVHKPFKSYLRRILFVLKAVGYVGSSLESRIIFFGPLDWFLESDFVIVLGIRLVLVIVGMWS